METFYVYILKCSDNSYYTGSTNNLEQRLAQHSAGEGSIWTANRLPVQLVFYEEYSSSQEAFDREHQIKKWTRKKKEALINSDFNLLAKLSKSG